MACALSVLTFSLPLSYGYTLSFIVIIIAELMRAAVRMTRSRSSAAFGALRWPSP